MMLSLVATLMGITEAEKHSMTKVPLPLRIEHWESIVGTRWSICDGFCVLSIHYSREEAETRLEAVRQANEERESEWARLDDVIARAPYLQRFLKK
jgi:hypothetical protein